MVERQRAPPRPGLRPNQVSQRRPDRHRRRYRPQGCPQPQSRLPLRTATHPRRPGCPDRGSLTRVQILNLTAVSVRRTLLAMRGYSQFCPVALACEVFAERWTPLIVRELLAGSHRFSELQRGLPGIPRALLVQRLGSLERAGLVERRPARTGRGWEYHLSVAGEELRPVVESLGRWGWRWAAWELQPDNLDSKLLMWFVRRRIRVDRLPPERVTVRLEFRS